ncbi:hypothetical protein ADEAN_000521500 [Angomonas deanei]|uniref:Uncharacterized protein n=1 Tax=Angomonas deanei TaxID=59799 RepID=A0A7G2CEF1_9TRYP|nr:hypothetical protein ADEAN_000521500 [Angomonas deanei]
MVAPEVKIEEWKKLYKKRITQLKELKMEDNEEEEEQDEDDNPLTESFVLDQIEQEKEKETKIKERQTILDPVLLPSPLLINTITELRRRLLREAAGKPPSKHTLEACLQEFLNETHVEDGALHDPLVTKNFYLYTAGPAVVGEDQANDTSNAHFRHQKVFQSDLVLLLLALLTSPRSGGAKSIVPHTISEDLSESMKRPQSSRRMTKVLKKMSAHINKSTTDVDAHTLTFVDLLQMKVDKHVTPLDKVRSGMMRLLFLNLPRFLLSKSVILLCEAAPLYEMLGLNESCPLPDLVNGWSAEITLSKSLNPSTISSTSSFLNTFVNYFWDEIYTRLEEKLYDKPAVQVMSQKMPSLLEKVRERHGQFVGVLDLISRRVKVVVPRGAKTAPTGEDSNNASKRLSLSTDRGSKQVRTLSLSMSMGGIDGKPVEYKSGEATSAFGIDSEKHVTLTDPSPYSEEYQQEEQRVRAILESLPMASKSIYSPKTLFHLLFRNTDVDVVTVKFVLKQPSVNGQVSANPLRDTAVPALQYAIEEHNFTIAKLLVGLGASLEELTDEGTTVLRCLAEEVFTEEEVSELMEVYRYNQRAVAADPNLGFGIYRTLAVDETDV